MRTLLQWLLFMRVIILSILLGTSVILQTKTHAIIIPPLDYVASFIAAVYLFTIISALAMRLLKNYWRFALTQIVSDALLAACIVYATGGSQSIFTIIYFLPIVSGSFILLRLGGLLMAAISTITYGFILLVELLYDHWFLKDHYSQLSDIFVAMHFFAVHGIVFFTVAVLCVIVFERMRRTESALFQSNLDYDRLARIYKQVFDDITTGIVTVDARGNISTMNRAAEGICGYRAGESVGKAFDKIFTNFDSGRGGKQQRLLAEITTRDGRIIPVGYSWAKLNLPEESTDCRVYTMQDLSEIRDMEKQIKQTEKMATIGGMAAGIAHEFRNPLAAVSGAAQMLKSETLLSSSSRKLVEIIARESDRLEDTIDNFLLFSKPAEPNPEWFSFKTMVDETITMLQQSRKWPSRNCRTVTYISESLDCWGDQRQIQQILLNLISNACQAMTENGGEIEITTEILAGKDGREEFVFRVSDNGRGIEERLRDTIFEPFFTTRENGTGLGLAIVRQLLECHEGRVEVSSGLEAGTVFTITLPLPPS
jgi:two-component system sensor histidine kinase PilS (NtrC family)